MAKTMRTKKLALKRETLRKLDSNELQQAAGGRAYTDYCAGGSIVGKSGGCTSYGCAGAILEYEYVVNVKYYG